MKHTLSRQRLTLGIYKDRIGFQAQVNGGRGKGNSRRFKKGTDLKVMKAWQRRRLAELATAPAQKPASQRHTLRADVPRFLATIPEGPQRKGFDAVLAAWLATPLATMHRSDITALDVRTQLAKWGSKGGRSKTGFAASTLNHRLSALRTLYRTLDGADAPNPCDGIAKFKEPEDENRGVTFDLAELILSYIKDRGGVHTPVRETKARIRLQVMLFTGLPPAQVMRIHRSHIDFDHGTLLTTPRRKGKGAPARRLPLLPRAVEVLRAFDRANCYGPFSTSPVRRAWEEAKRKVLETITEATSRELIAGLRPYDLRHTFLSEVYRHSGDHRAARELGLHSDERTTNRYTGAAVSERAQKAVQALQAAYPAATAAATQGNPNNQPG